MQVTPRQMQVNRRVFKLGVAKKNLDGAQISTGFQHVGGEAMPKQMRRYVLLDAGTFNCLVDSVPDDLLSNGHICTPIVHCAWK